MGSPSSWSMPVWYHPSVPPALATAGPPSRFVFPYYHQASPRASISVIAIGGHNTYTGTYGNDKSAEVGSSDGPARPPSGGERRTSAASLIGERSGG